MKVRCGYVSNSSSTSFVIRNISGEPKTLVDFAKETAYLCEEFERQYKIKYAKSDYIQSAKDRQFKGTGFALSPGESIKFAFGDEDGDAIGYVCDYMLRLPKQTASFSWEFDQWLR